MGPFSTSRNGNRYVAIAVDAFSKYVEAKGNYHKTHYNIQEVGLINSTITFCETSEKIPYREI